MNHPEKLRLNAALGQDPCGHGGYEAGGHPARGTRWLLPASVVLAVAAELWALRQGAESTIVVAVSLCPN